MASVIFKTSDGGILVQKEYPRSTDLLAEVMEDFPIGEYFSLTIGCDERSYVCRKISTDGEGNIFVIADEVRIKLVSEDGPDVDHDVAIKNLQQFNPKVRICKNGLDIGADFIHFGEELVFVVGDGFTSEHRAAQYKLVREE